MSAINMKIDKFTGRNSFCVWQIKMRDLLTLQDLTAPLSKAVSEVPVNDVDTATLDIDKKARRAILSSLAKDIIPQVASETTAAGLRSKLESLFLPNKLVLKLRWFSLRMQEGTPLEDHLDEFNSILFELRHLGVTIEDEEAAEMLLISLPLSYENFVRCLIIGRDAITLDEVRTALQTREQLKLLRDRAP